MWVLPRAGGDVSLWPDIPFDPPAPGVVSAAHSMHST